MKNIKESSRDLNVQSHGKFTFCRKQGRFTSRTDKTSSGEFGMCFSHGGNGHRAIECANNRKLSKKRDKAMMSTWSEGEKFVYSDESSNDEEKIVAIIALIKEVSK